MIYVKGCLLPADEELVARAMIYGGHLIPDPARCDGCSYCPDFYPVGFPRHKQVPLRVCCVVHDFEPPYEGGGTAWDRTIADLRLLSNWLALPTLFPERAVHWGIFTRWAYAPLMLSRFLVLRLLGRRRGK